MLRDERHVRRDDRAGHVRGERQQLLLGAVVHVVEKHPADTAALVHAVLDDEVLVRPLLELGVERLVVLVAHVLERAVEVRGVVVEDVRGRQIRAAAEPPGARAALGALGGVRLEVPVVEVHGGRHGVVRVHHGGDAGGEEGDHLLARALLAGGGAVRLGGHLAVHHGHVHASLLEHVAALQDARDAAAAAGARPGILLELLAVQLLDRAANLILRGANHLLEACAHGVGVVLAALAEKRQGSLVDGDLLLDADSADVRLARGARGDAGGACPLGSLGREADLRGARIGGREGSSEEGPRK